MPLMKHTACITFRVGVTPCDPGEEGVGQLVQDGVAGQRPHRQRDQELDEVLVEGLLQFESIDFQSGHPDL